MVLAICSYTLLVVHNSSTRTEELNSDHLLRPIWVEGTYDGMLPGAPNGSFIPSCHHLTAMQPFSRCHTPWLRWTRALFAILQCYLSPWQGRLGLDSRGGVTFILHNPIKSIMCLTTDWMTGFQSLAETKEFSSSLSVTMISEAHAASNHGGIGSKGWPACDTDLSPPSSA
jgi:hypothetical protein